MYGMHQYFPLLLSEMLFLYVNGPVSGPSPERKQLNGDHVCMMLSMKKQDRNLLSDQPP